MQSNTKAIIFHPLLIAWIIVLGLHVFLITRFPFIAEKDSYSWLMEDETALASQSIQAYRPLFSSVTITLQHLTGNSLFNIYKYLIPFLSTTSLLPLWLLARRQKHLFFKLLLLIGGALPTASVILQNEAPRPNLLVMTFLYFFIGILSTASEIKARRFVIILLGATSVYGFYLHRIFIFFACSFFLSLIIEHRSFILRNWRKVILCLFFAYPWILLSSAKTILQSYGRSTLQILINIFIEFNTNFRFPASYINIDGRQMGWTTAAGVLKYYAFYAGPLVALILLLFFGLLACSARFRQIIRSESKQTHFLTFTILFAFFFSIAEILPRIANLAFLPDRAWIFLAILSVLPFNWILLYLTGMKNRLVTPLAILLISSAIITSVIGATIINSGFATLVSKHEKEAFQWIKESLAENRVIYSDGYKNLLSYHSGSQVKRLDITAIQQRSRSSVIANLNGNKHLSNTENIKTLASEIGNLASLLEDKVLEESDAQGQIDTIRAIQSALKNLLSAIPVPNTKDSEPITYIYFAAPETDNPYTTRLYETGYYSKLTSADIDFLNKMSALQQVYNDDSKVIIWKLNQ